MIAIDLSPIKQTAQPDLHEYELPNPPFAKAGQALISSKTVIIDENEIFPSDPMTSDPTYFDDFVPPEDAENEQSPQSTMSSAIPTLVESVSLTTSRRTSISDRGHGVDVEGQGRADSCQTGPADCSCSSPVQLGSKKRSLSPKSNGRAKRLRTLGNVEHTQSKTVCSGAEAVSEVNAPSMQGERADATTIHHSRRSLPKDIYEIGEEEVEENTHLRNAPRSFRPSLVAPEPRARSTSPESTIIVFIPTDIYLAEESQQTAPEDSEEQQHHHDSPSSKASLPDPTHDTTTSSVGTCGVPPQPDQEEDSIIVVTRHETKPSIYLPNDLPIWQRGVGIPDTKRKSLTKSQKRGNILELRISIAATPSDHAYVVEHDDEASEAIVGGTWRQADAYQGFREKLSKHATIRYSIGDIVKVNFGKSPGGFAKIVEIRIAQELLVVVQWLYTRKDAGTKCDLEDWPHGSYVLSNHFQLLSAENLTGHRGPAPLEDVYWSCCARLLRPQAEIVARLRNQWK